VARLLSLGSLRNALLRRTLLVWAALRVALAFGGAADPRLVTELLVIALVPGVVLLDACRRGEDLLLGNLGIPRWTIVQVSMPVVALLEILVP